MRPARGRSRGHDPVIDLQAQRRRLGQPLEDAILKVVRSGAYVMGPEIGQFEAALAAFGQAPYALSCGSGTEALILPLMAWEIGPAPRCSARPSPSPRRPR